MLTEGLQPIDDLGTAKEMSDCGRMAPQTAAIANNIAIGDEKIVVCRDRKCAGRFLVSCVIAQLSNVDGSQSVDVSKTTMTACVANGDTYYNVVCAQYFNLS